MGKNNFKNQNGFVAADSIIAILLITLFTGIIMTLSYNIYLTSAFIKRNSQATEYIVKIFEEIDKEYYDDLTVENLDSFIESLDIPDGYEITPNIYNGIPSETFEEDLIKTVKIKIEYELGKTIKYVEMSKLKTRENLITPNKPELSSAGDGKTIIPIEYVDELQVKVTNSEDTTWYNYANGIWAAGILVNNENVTEYEADDIINIADIDAIYLWIPRYSYDEINELTNDVKFLYSTSNKYVEKEIVSDFGKLENIPAGHQIPSTFTDITGIWLTEDEINEALEGSTIFNIYNNLNKSQYERKNIFSE